MMRWVDLCESKILMNNLINAMLLLRMPLVSNEKHIRHDTKLLYTCPKYLRRMNYGSLFLLIVIIINDL